MSCRSQFICVTFYDVTTWCFIIWEGRGREGCDDVGSFIHEVSLSYKCQFPVYNIKREREREREGGALMTLIVKLISRLHSVATEWYYNRPIIIYFHFVLWSQINHFVLGNKVCVYIYIYILLRNRSCQHVHEPENHIVAT